MDVVNAWGPVLVSTAVTISLIALLWRAVLDQLDARFSAFESQFTREIEGLNAKFDGFETRLGAKIDGFESRLGAKIDASGDVQAEKLAGVDQRLSALETDMTLVKQHLLKTSVS